MDLTRLQDAYALRDRVLYGHELRRIRLAYGYTLRELAGVVGYRHTVVSQWERGERRPRASTHAEILEALALGSPYQTAMATLIGRAYRLGYDHDVGILLRRARLDHGYTIAECSRALGVSHDTWATWEASRHVPRLPLLRAAIAWVEHGRRNIRREG